MGECWCVFAGVLFPGWRLWWLSWTEGAVEAAGQVEILKWVFDVVGQCHPGLTDCGPNGFWTRLDLATTCYCADSDRLQFTCTYFTVATF
jgi:hypothetical protein